MKKSVFLFAHFISTILFGQIETSIPIDQLNFNGLYASHISGDETTSYWICGFNSINGPRENYIHLIESWLKKHPNAVFKPVSSALVAERGKKNSMMIYGWVIDGNKNMNIFLAENGGLKASALTKFITFKDIDDESKMKYSWLTEEDMKFFISEIEYSDYLKKLHRAEKKAKRKKLGVWK